MKPRKAIIAQEGTTNRHCGESCRLGLLGGFRMRGKFTEDTSRLPELAGLTFPHYDDTETGISQFARRDLITFQIASEFRGPE